MGIISVYAAKLKDVTELEKSSSGGAFTALSNIFLKNGDAVICSVYNYLTKQVEFNIIESMEARNKARGSKYVQSVPGNIFNNTYKWLQEHPGKKVLYVGTGCQAAGFIKYSEYKGIRERVFVVDIICHGAPSPRIWKDYAGFIESKYHGEINYLTFKDKRKGWENPTAFANINEEEILLCPYTRMFYKSIILRPSCYKCPYTTLDRNTDVTIGDFWGINKVLPKFYDTLGVSLVLIHTEKGAGLFEQSIQYMDYVQCSEEDCLQPNLIHPTERPESRKQFWNDYYLKGIKYILKKYGDISVKQKIKRKIRSALCIREN